VLFAGLLLMVPVRPVASATASTGVPLQLLHEGIAPGVALLPESITEFGG
jgi:hypothetical protein